ncbi:uncharacterized protein LY89DRAFT_597421 [Mollisia scopiformis]|uniref:Uncharacterized protein n=1 Tax=Mollisia scopiformis TaxID=149040 RepID=A0A132BBS7_MOLSC|nr:uncharacterized protein LY89DRAFT_597421 [Mollisia scopiformis]KUJ09828.1 hypothetical protein LY89DRAFT_597421 [Mollisia scopiformis]
MGFFSNRYMFAVHVLQIILVLLAIGGSVVRLLIVKVPAGAPRSRANTMALGMGAKSLIVILYQVLSEHTAMFRKWASLKANMILNCMEIVFWAAVVFLMIQANLKFCVGTNCILSWVVTGVAGTLSTVAAYTAIVSIMDFRCFKSTGMHRGSEVELKNEQVEDGRSMDEVRRNY